MRGILRRVCQRGGRAGDEKPGGRSGDRHYRIVLSNQDIVIGGSAFNIKAESLHLGNFTKEEIHELYMQHTATTGQEFDEACFPLIWEAAEGQPWLVNALGYEVTTRRRTETAAYASYPMWMPTKA